MTRRTQYGPRRQRPRLVCQTEIVPARVIKSVTPHIGAPMLPAQEFAEDAEMIFLALFTIRADGTADVEMVRSTGDEAMDAVALEAARQWTFEPATYGGVPVQSYLRLRIEFELMTDK
ncbi:MAG: energy transducer TonB [Armatimonadetes bacterium]|nr:energy transducer TonB [Armatimonadota bacterium]